MVEFDIKIYKRIIELLQRYNKLILVNGIDSNLRTYMNEYLCRDMAESSCVVLEKNYFMNIFDVCDLTEIEVKLVYDLYGLYEYTDKILYLSDNCKLPTILNYVRQGILTKEEMIEVIFH